MSKISYLGKICPEAARLVGGRVGRDAGVRGVGVGGFEWVGVGGPMGGWLLAHRAGVVGSFSRSLLTNQFFMCSTDAHHRSRRPHVAPSSRGEEIGSGMNVRHACRIHVGVAGGSTL